jgi:hypothetical protein
MTPSGFKPAIPASERPQTPSLDSAATGIGAIYWGGTMNTSHERKSVHTLRLVSELTFFSWKKTGMILKPASDHGRKLTSPTEQFCKSFDSVSSVKQMSVDGLYCCSAISIQHSCRIEILRFNNLSIKDQTNKYYCNLR